MQELVPKGTLYSYLHSHRHLLLSKSKIFQIFKQVVSAVEYLHSQGVVHRDLKPENILLDSKLNAKICDFGWSVLLNEKATRTTFCGTYEYMAPEILNSQSYDLSVDIWSLGILLYEIFHLKTPFNGGNFVQVYLKILSNTPIEFKPDLDPLVVDLITRLLKRDPRERMQASDILQHPFFTTQKSILRTRTLANTDGASLSHNSLIFDSKGENKYSPFTKVHALLSEAKQELSSPLGSFIARTRKVNEYLEKSSNKVNFEKFESFNTSRKRSTTSREWSQDHEAKSDDDVPTGSPVRFLIELKPCSSPKLKQDHNNSFNKIQKTNNGTSARAKNLYSLSNKDVLKIISPRKRSPTFISKPTLQKNITRNITNLRTESEMKERKIVSKSSSQPMIS